MKFPDAPFLFHYCSTDALVSIIKDQMLWAGQLSVMNDYMERSWLRRLAIQDLQIYSADDRLAMTGNEQVRQRADVRNAIRHILDAWPVPDDPYCICFSKSGDVLSQWRAYADGGRGVAIGFQSDMLRDWLKPTNDSEQKTFVAEVEYDENAHSGIVRRLLKEALDEFAAERSRKYTDRLDAVARNYFAKLLRESAHCKNPAFREEQEVRVVLDREYAHEYDYRSRGGKLVNFLCIYFAQLFEEDFPTLEIWLGPKSQTAEKTLNSFLQDFYKGGRWEIKRSTATLT